MDKEIIRKKVRKIRDYLDEWRWDHQNELSIIDVPCFMKIVRACIAIDKQVKDEMEG